MKKSTLSNLTLIPGGKAGDKTTEQQSRENTEANRKELQEFANTLRGLAAKIEELAESGEDTPIVTAHIAASSPFFGPNGFGAGVESHLYSSHTHDLLITGDFLISLMTEVQAQLFEARKSRVGAHCYDELREVFTSIGDKRLALIKELGALKANLAKAAQEISETKNNN